MKFPIIDAHMKRIFILMLILAAISCCTKPDTPVTEKPETETIPPTEEDEVEVTLSLEQTEIMIGKGDTFQLTATVTPEDTQLKWESSDTKKVLIDRNGNGKGIAFGEATITVTAGDKSATCLVKVMDKPKIGDFYYSDGTYMSTYDPSKEVIGIVFWTGDPTAEDPALKMDHPECTNGLVVSIAGDRKGYSWQPNYEAYASTVGSWVEQNIEGFVSMTSPWGEDENVNAIRGYNNTKAIEAFNAAPENSQWPVDVVANVLQYRIDNPTPESSSDWYLPSVKECTLLISGETEGNVLDINGDVSVMADINYKLSLVPGSNSLGRNGYEDDIWSSNERDDSYAFYVSTLTGKVWMNWKLYGSDCHQVRYILAF